MLLYSFSIAQPLNRISDMKRHNDCGARRLFLQRSRFDLVQFDSARAAKVPMVLARLRLTWRQRFGNKISLPFVLSFEGSWPSCRVGPDPVFGRHAAVLESEETSANPLGRRLFSGPTGNKPDGAPVMALRNETEELSDAGSRRRA